MDKGGSSDTSSSPSTLNFTSPGAAGASPATRPGGHAAEAALAVEGDRMGGIAPDHAPTEKTHMADVPAGDSRFSFERPLESGLFLSRWLMAPFYVGLVLALAMLLVV